MRITKSGVAAAAIGLSLTAFFVADSTRDGKRRDSLAAARQDLADIGRIGTNAIGATSEEGGKRRRELEEQRTKLDEGAAELVDAQREIQRTKATHAATDASYAATLETQRLKVDSLESDLAAAHVSNNDLQQDAKLAASKQADLLAGKELAEADATKATEALDGERRSAAAAAEKASAELARLERDYARGKAELAATIEQQRLHITALQHDIAVAAQFVAEIERRSKTADSEHVKLLPAKDATDAAAKEAGEALDRERERATALANDLEAARQGQVLAQEELARVSAASNDALDQESEKSASLGLQLASARKDIQALTRRLNRYATNASTGDSGVRSENPIKITLPNVLRPTRPAAAVLPKSPIDR